MSKVQETKKEIVKDKEIYPYSCTPRAARATFTPLGERFMIRAKLSVNPETGEKIAEPGEKIDLFAYVQASKATCDMEQIIKRWQAGDESVINVNPNGFSGDVSIIPNSVNDVEKIYQLSDQARKRFDAFPDDLKAVFNNDASQFFNAVLNNTVDEITKKYFESKKVSPKVEPGEGGNE